MQIGSATSTLAATLARKSGNNVPTGAVAPSNTPPEKNFVRELAESFDPANMTRKESIEFANALMKAGEGDLSTVFLPPPLLKVNSDGSITDLTGTPESEEILNQKFDMFDSLASRIEYRKSVNEPTKLLEEAFSFIEKIQAVRNTPSVDLYT